MLFLGVWVEQKGRAAAQSLPTLEERECQNSGGMNTQSHIEFFSDPELFTDIRSPDIIL